MYMRDLTVFPMTIKSSDIGIVKIGNDVSKEICIQFIKVVENVYCYLSVICHAIFVFVLHLSNI